MIQTRKQKQKKGKSQGAEGGKLKQWKKECQYGRDCRRVDCRYRHPEGRKIDEECSACPDGILCAHPDCTKTHPLGRKAQIPCKYGSACMFQDCPFNHEIAFKPGTSSSCVGSLMLKSSWTIAYNSGQPIRTEGLFRCSLMLFCSWAC